MNDEDINNLLSLEIFLTTKALPEKFLTCLIDKLRILCVFLIFDSKYEESGIESKHMLANLSVINIRTFVW